MRSQFWWGDIIDGLDAVGDAPVDLGPTQRSLMMEIKAGELWWRVTESVRVTFSNEPASITSHDLSLNVFIFKACESLPLPCFAPPEPSRRSWPLNSTKFFILLVSLPFPLRPRFNLPRGCKHPPHLFYFTRLSGHLGRKCERATGSCHKHSVFIVWGNDTGRSRLTTLSSLMTEDL